MTTSQRQRSGVRGCPVLVQILCVLLLVTHVESKEEKGDHAGKSAEARLLDGELLELSEGDLKKALEVYDAIQAEKGAPGTIRARALLYMARCYRKLGQLEKAKRLLKTLVENQTAEREVVRQARSFLRELTGARVENPDFDWLRELERNPTIQKRVFELAMNLAGESAETARTELLAFGPIALPVLQRVVQTSRDARHRQTIALIMMHSGRFDQLELVLNADYPPVRNASFVLFLKTIPTLSEHDRYRLVTVAKRLSGRQEVAVHVNLIRVLAGDQDSINERLLRLELLEGANGFGVQEAFEILIGRESPIRSQVISWVAQRLLEAKCASACKYVYYQILKDKRPQALRAAHIVVLLRCEELRHAYGDFLEELDQRKADDALIQLIERDAPGVGWTEDFLRQLVKRSCRVAEAMADRVQYSECPRQSTYYKVIKEQRPEVLKSEHLVGLAKTVPGYVISVAQELVERGEFAAIAELVEEETAGAIATVWNETRDKSAPTDIPVGWTVVLKRLRHNWLHLRWLAEHNDDAVSVLVDFLGKWDVQDIAPVGGDRDDPSWRPSDEYVEGMRSLLDTSKPAALAIALEALSLAPERLDDATISKIQLLANSAEDLHVREFALYALIAAVPEKPATGPTTARSFFLEYERRQQADELPEAYHASVLYRLRELGSVSRQRSGVRRANWPSCESLGWLVRSEGTVALYPHIISLSENGDAVGFHEWCLQMIRKNRRDGATFATTLAGRLTSLENRELRQSLCFAHEKTARDFLRSYLALREPVLKPLKDFLRAAVNDTNLSIKARVEAYDGLGDPSWIDWEPFLAGSDPLASELVTFDSVWTWIEALDEEKRSAIEQATATSSQARVRASFISRYPLDRDDVLEVFARAFEDPERSVRFEACNRLTTVSRADAGPLFVPLLQDTDVNVRLGAIVAAKRFASPTAIGPLVLLLDDASITVREKALDALRSIRERLEEKRQWHDLIRTLKESR